MENYDSPVANEPEFWMGIPIELFAAFFKYYFFLLKRKKSVFCWS